MTGESDQPIADGPPLWASLLDDHRRAWAAGVLSGWGVVDLADEEDPVAALADASADTAFVWLEGYAASAGDERLAAAIDEARQRGAPVLIGFESDEAGAGQRDAEQLRSMLAGARVATQELAAGSLIGAGPDEPNVRRRSAHLFVYANLELDTSDSRLAASVAPLATGYLDWLEQANRRLRAANARLAREHLGQHDAAAAAVTNRRVALERRIEELEGEVEQQREAAAASHQAFLQAQWDKDSTLSAPRYRIVDSLRELAFNLPGVSSLLGLRSRRVSKRWERD